MQAAKKKTRPAEDTHDEASGVSVSIRWWHGGWALAVVIAAVVIARVLGFV